jgi:hypothetical protein
MEKLDNKPIQVGQFRICYVANGRWQLQQDSGNPGRNSTMKSRYGEKLPHEDRWTAISQPMTFLEAKGRLDNLGKTASLG